MKNERCWYVAIVFFTLALLFALTYTQWAYAQEEQVDDWIPIPGVSGAKFVKAQNAMRISVDKPLLKDRYKAYGRVITDASGVAKPDLSSDKLLTNAGREIYRRIMALTNKNGVFAVFSVSVRHTHVDIVKYNSIKWDWLEPQIFKVVKQVMKKK